MHKRKIVCFAIILLLISLFSAGCYNQRHQPNNQPLSFVSFLDVGQGDCIFIKFSDGKTMLIDCGQPSSKVSDYVINFIRGKKVNKIDYFVLTHPDSDHIGNAIDIINSFEIGTVYIPDIHSSNFNLLPVYADVYNLIYTRNIKTCFMN